MDSPNLLLADDPYAGIEDVELGDFAIDPPLHQLAGVGGIPAEGESDAEENSDEPPKKRAKKVYCSHDGNYSIRARGRRWRPSHCAEVPAVQLHREWREERPEDIKRARQSGSQGRKRAPEDWADCCEYRRRKLATSR